MNIEVRFVEGCPNLPVIRQRLADVLDAVGRGDAEVRLRTIRTAHEARKLRFTGSPTILIEGRDPFPQPHAMSGLACRLYPTAEGISGSPSVKQLTAALLGRCQPGCLQ
jgi:hypothetical protein